MISIESAQQYMSVAESGDLQAQFTLALMYANGKRLALPSILNFHPVI